ncbi:MAG: hypothetical protein CVV50_02730, partial [Spirochaetae bacterium HGW-Spirochaetae-6]
LVAPEDVEFLYELLSFFYDYNEGILAEEEELSVIGSIIQELEFIRNIPRQLEEELEELNRANPMDLFDDVRTVLETMMEEAFPGQQAGLYEGLTARIALGLGMRYEDDLIDPEEQVQMSYDEEQDEIIITNLVVNELSD